MKFTLKTIISTVAVIFSVPSWAADDVTLQLKWVPQAQFAGYYVALDRGFYKKEDLNVTIRPGGPNTDLHSVIRDQAPDVIVEWMPLMLAIRESGMAVVNVAQPFKRSGLMLTCRKDAGISSPKDFRGKTIGVWHFGNEYPFLSWMNNLGIPTNGGKDGVTVLKQSFSIQPILQG